MTAKRDATPEEEAEELATNAERWNLMNPRHGHGAAFWQAKLAEAKAEGYKSEVCGCGAVFLAFHHLTNCNAAGCPFSFGVSMLDQLKESLDDTQDIEKTV